MVPEVKDSTAVAAPPDTVDCQECGTELPADVHAAGEALYGPYSTDISGFARQLERVLAADEREQVKREPERLVLAALGAWLDVNTTEAFAEAVRHFRAGGGCEQAQDARFCGAKAPWFGNDQLANGDDICDREGLHDGPHTWDTDEARERQRIADDLVGRGHPEMLARRITTGPYPFMAGDALGLAR